MALTSTEEALVRQLLDQQAAILSLAGNESTITSKLGATKVTLSDLVAASSISDSDLLLVRQGTSDKRVAGSILKLFTAQSDASETVKGIVELATASETVAGTDAVRAVHPAGLASALAGVGATVEGSFKKLAASATGLSANVSVSADEIVLQNSTNQYKTLRNVALTLAGTAVGANGLDAGTIAANTWYSLWIIWNGTTAAGLMSLSATAPTLPSGYTHKARVGWIFTDGTANKYPLSFKQYGRRVQYVVAAGSNVTNMRQLGSGVTAASWVALGVSAFVPPTASSIKITILGGINVNSYTVAAPNNSYPAPSNSAGTGTAYPISSATGGASSSAHNGLSDLVLESTNIYWSSNAASGGIWCLGWEDNL